MNTVNILPPTLIILLAIYISHHSNPLGPLKILGCPGVIKISSAVSLLISNKETSKNWARPLFVSTASKFSPFSEALVAFHQGLPYNNPVPVFRKSMFHSNIFLYLRHEQP